MNRIFKITRVIIVLAVCSACHPKNDPVPSIGDGFITASVDGVIFKSDGNGSINNFLCSADPNEEYVYKVFTAEYRCTDDTQKLVDRIIVGGGGFFSRTKFRNY